GGHVAGAGREIVVVDRAERIALHLARESFEIVRHRRIGLVRDPLLDVRAERGAGRLLLRRGDQTGVTTVRRARPPGSRNDQERTQDRDPGGGDERERALSAPESIRREKSEEEERDEQT